MKKPRKAETSVWEEPDAYDKDKYSAHLLDQYKLYIEMIDRLSARRVLVNNSFITMMGAGAIAFAAAPQHFPGAFSALFQLGVTTFCILLAVMWRATIRYYRDLSSAKFKVISEMEALLPAQPFKMEWEYLQAAQRATGKKLHRGLATMEMLVPLIAIAIAAIGLVATLPKAYQTLPEIWTATPHK
jgi:hypothetical protein